MNPHLLNYAVYWMLTAILIAGCNGGKHYFSGNPQQETPDSETGSAINDTGQHPLPGDTDSVFSVGDTDGDTDTDSDTDMDTDTDTDADADTDTDTDIDTDTDTDADTGTPPDTEDTESPPPDSDTGDPPDTADTESVADTNTVPEETDPPDSDTVVLVDTDEHLDSDAVPTEVPEVQIEIADALWDALEADPFDGPDVLGVFVDQDGGRHDVELNYRGAYALLTLMNMGRVQRNWKIKFPKTDKYQNRREWNFNYEPNVRQKLAYDLLKFAGVKMPAPRHVRLRVNGEAHGLYLEYEDPDSKDWLRDRFGDDEGDLYKAAYDKPDEPRYFADLTYLGDLDEDYFYHYDKKTNDNVYPDDYSSLRAFLDALNHTPDEEFAAWLKRTFDCDRFITYLAVSNFISNWDGYPQRPKNFWMYNNPTGDVWSFIPWDVDNTFQLYLTNLNQMGTDASIFYQFDEYEPYDLQEEEGTERPLVRRMMVHSEFRNVYVERYKMLMDGVLNEDYISNRASRLTDLIRSVASEEDSAEAADAENEILEFVSRRTESVTDQLSSY